MARQILDFDKNARIWHVRYEKPVPVGIDPETGLRRFASIVPPLSEHEQTGWTYNQAANHAIVTGGQVYPYRPTAISA